MRDRRFIAEHRGGALGQDAHRALMAWALTCARHVLPLARGDLGAEVAKALDVAENWARGRATTGAAMAAARAVHRAARGIDDPVDRAIARAVGHAVATGHMADHSLGAAIYAVKAARAAGLSEAEEIAWQQAQLPDGLRVQVTELRAARDPAFRGASHY